jgi:hypothetical protein
MMVTTDPATEQVTVTRAFADGPWPTLGALLGVGRVAEVFACGELVVKLYKPAVPKCSPFGEAAILTAVERGLLDLGARGVIRSVHSLQPKA